jgi:hypothetical protein
MSLELNVECRVASLFSYIKGDEKQHTTRGTLERVEKHEKYYEKAIFAIISFHSLLHYSSPLRVVVEHCQSNSNSSFGLL